MASYLILVLVFVAVLFAFLAVGSLVQSRRTQQSLRRRLAGLSSTGAPRAVAEAPLLAMPEATTVNRILRSWSLLDRIALGLVQANLRLRLTEYLLLRAVIGLVLAAIGFAISRSMVAAAGLFVLGYLVPRFYVQRRATRRVNQFLDQLPDTLDLMANSLRAGFGIAQVIGDLAGEMAPPLSEEFQRVYQEMSLGESLEVALAHLQTRLRSYDLDLVVTALLVQRRVGGNLAEILDSIAHTIRERVQILGEVRALTAEVRLSANILAALPLLTGLVFTIISPSYLQPLITTDIGRLISVGALVFMAVGIYMLRRLGTIEV